jgi:hypothetical protein
MPVTAGLQLPFGIQPVNPVPVDAWSGPFSGTPDTLEAALAVANAAIPTAVRFQSMEVRLIVGGTARKFWYRDGVSDGDLVEFSSSSPPPTPASISTLSWSFMERPLGQVDNVNTSFVLGATPSPANSLMLFVNGVLQMQGAGYDYTLTGPTVAMAYPVLDGSRVVATYSYLQQGGTIAWMEQVSGTVDGVNSTFTLKNPPNPTNTLMFFVNGILQSQEGDYTLAGNSISMAYAPLQGANLSATYTY